MPTYDYECSNGHRFECLQSITAEPLTECVTCGEPVRRLIGGGTGIIFKGSGFYVTDSKNGSHGKKASDQDSDTTAAAKDKDARDKDPKDRGGDKPAKSDAKNGSDSSSSSGGDKQDKPVKTAAAT